MHTCFGFYYICTSNIKIILTLTERFMDTNEKEKLKHPYYQLMELSGDKLQSTLLSWSREDLIEWLTWNDRNGVYRDDDSLREFDNILSQTEAIKIIIKQITES